MADVDPTALPPELADPADIEALNAIARENGLSAAEMIRDAIHKAVLAHRVWDTPFFEEAYTPPSQPEGTTPALLENGPDMAMYFGDDHGGHHYLVQAKYSGKRRPATRSYKQFPSPSHALASAKALRQRDPDGWNAIRTLLLAQRIPVKRLKPGTREQALSKVSQDPELNALFKELKDVSAALSRHLFPTEQHDLQPPLFDVEEQVEEVDEADEAVLVLFQSAAAAQEDSDS
ncbi:CopG family transcriptional regulator [Streptomyces filamentosus]|uniref:ribbon-helix-helix domain-containing protein n=1 Tax=Streptomyces filamentosus TaxID=67294 RepID=UPI00331E56A2